MQLAEWRRVRGLTQAELARLLNVAASTVASWEQRAKLPGPDLIGQIYAESQGAVQPNDFYDLPDLGERRAA